MGRVRAVAGAVVWVGVVVGLVIVSSTPASASSSTFAAPVHAGDFPDASIVLANGTYWAYSTGSAGRNLQVMSSPDLHTWSTPITDPLPTLPSWASTGRTWAPGVIPLGGTYVMYYTVHDRSLNQQCISVATSTSPSGPFADQSPKGPLICQTANGGSIDPNPYVDPVSGTLYLLWKSDDNSLGRPTHIWAQPLTTNGLLLASGTVPSLLLTESASWQAPSAEGPTMIRSGGRYYLFYGANNYDSASSGIGYATSSSLLTGYRNQSKVGPWLGTRQNAQGPQGPCLFTDASGATRMAFAAWYGTVGYENGGVRSLWVGSLGFNRFGTPSLT